MASSTSLPSPPSQSQPAEPFSIPTIDISPYLLDPSSPASLSAIQSIRTACTTAGFFQITGHGVSRELQDRVLAGTEAFFKLPLEEKTKMDRMKGNGPSNRGYELIGSQTLGKGQGIRDRKEGFYISEHIEPGSPLAATHPKWHGPNIWPPASILPHATFKAPLSAYFAEMNRVVRTLLALLAHTLPHGPSIFAAFLSPVPLAILRPLHYPPGPPGTVGAGGHTDFGALTLLLQDGAGGLEVLHEGAWTAVPPDRDALVVNVGDMLERWTRGVYRSATHRVVTAGDGARDRYSVPFFFDGNLETRLVPWDGGREGEVYVTVEEHMVERYQETYGGK